MNLIEKFAERIDKDRGYDNLSMAKDLAKISEEHHGGQGPVDRCCESPILLWDYEVDIIPTKVCRNCGRVHNGNN